MKTQNVESGLKILESISNQILDRLFIPAPLIQPSSFNQIDSQFQEEFERASKLYLTKKYHDAFNGFSSLISEFRNLPRNISIFILANAAASALPAGKINFVIDNLQPVFLAGNLYGLPLWNLSLGHYKQGNIQEAIKTMQAYIAKLPENQNSRLGRGEFICACLYVISGDKEKAMEHLERATQYNPTLVENQLSTKHSPGEKTTKQRVATDDKIQKSMLIELEKIVLPKRPFRSPDLSKYISPEEIERYSLGLELLAEGDIDGAQVLFQDLYTTHSDVVILTSAVAACHLFNGNHTTALNMLKEAVQAGYDLPGFALWNMACAHIKLGNLEDAEKALKECSETEYKTSSRLWTALKLLTEEQDKPSVIVKDKKEKTTLDKQVSRKGLTYQLPTTLHEIRVELLKRLIKPRKLPASFRPDLGRLAGHEHHNVSIIINAASKMDPSEAAKMLTPLVSQYPQVYTLKVHAGAYLVLNNDYETARLMFTQAQGLQRLDGNSTYNLAYTYLQDGDYKNIARVLNDASSSTLAGQHMYWITLAIAQELAGESGATSAGRAIVLVQDGPAKSTVNEILKAAGIQPDPSVSLESPYVSAARNALRMLNEDEIEAATNALVSRSVPSYEKIPEVGLHILQPEYIQNPRRGMQRNIADKFRSAVSRYENEHFHDAVTDFNVVYKREPISGVALNLAAALLKSGDPKRARKVTRSALQRRPGYQWVWRLAYNYALADQQVGEHERGIHTIQQYLKRIENPRFRKRLNSLLVALCMSSPSIDQHTNTLLNAIRELRDSVPEPSDALLLAYAWVQLKLDEPDVDGAQSSLRRLAQASDRQLVPAAEVNSMNRVRSAFDTFMLAGEPDKVVDYMETVIEARSYQRQLADELSKRQLEQSIGVEHIARVSLVRALHKLNHRERLLQELYNAELLIFEYGHLLAPGFLARDWLELASVAIDVQLYKAAVRYCNRGLEIGPEDSKLEEMLEKTNHLIDSTHEQQISNIIRKLRIAFETDEHSDYLDELRLLETFAPSTVAALNELPEAMAPEDSDDVGDRTMVLGRMELSESSYSLLEEFVNWVSRTKGGEDYRLPIDVDVYDERIWPRSDDEREGSCLLTVISGVDVKDIRISEVLSERTIWQGAMKVGSTEFVRWTLFQEEGLPSSSYLEIPILIESTNKSGSTSAQISLTLTVGSSDLIWPVYPTGALSPEDVLGAELYGRTALIRQIIRSLGPTRSQATYFLQGPRQMGKTSLLYFIKEQAPSHVLPIYVSFEKKWSKHEPNNIWNYLVQRVQEEVPSSIDIEANASYSEVHFVQAVSKACDLTDKSYALILVDELHFLFERSDDPSSVLAEFRDFLNNQSYRIALLLSDRYTRDELMQQCPSEYWAQLSVLNVGPLDYESTKLAVENPSKGTDVSFLPETIDQLFYLTGGYPYHVQRVAQMVLEHNYSGPWVTALPEDVDKVISNLIDQDILFQSGLCRPDRIDDTVAYAIAALLEWRDLYELLPKLVEENKDRSKALETWNPQIDLFLVHFPQSGRLLRRLIEIGIVREDGDNFFSPLLEMWLRKMRTEAKSLRDTPEVNHWLLLTSDDGAKLDGAEWQNLDSELVRRSKHKGKPPLKERATRADDWNKLVREVEGESDFRVFLDTLYTLFIDGREEKSSLVQYPWLFLVYHRIRLIRNYVVHQSESQNAIRAWNDFTSRSFGGVQRAYWPVASFEWRNLQVALLRNLHASLLNAIEIAGRPS